MPITESNLESSKDDIKLYIQHIGGDQSIVDKYLENFKKVNILEKEKKEAAMDEDFEKAMDCKKQL